MRIGRLRHRLALQSVSTAQDEYGQPIETFATYATVWGMLEPLQARELLTAQQQNAEITHHAIIRYNSNVAITNRISFDSRTFEIVSLTNAMERNARIELLLKEKL